MRGRGRGRDLDALVGQSEGGGIAGLGSALPSTGDRRGERLRWCSDQQLRRDGRCKCLLWGTNGQKRMVRWSDG